MRIVYGYAIFMVICDLFMVMFEVFYYRFAYGLWFTAALGLHMVYGLWSLHMISKFLAFAYGDAFCMMYGHFVSKCMAFAYGDAFCNFAINMT